jgi:hypothetical protein
VGVDLEQDRDAVPGAAGDLGRRYSGVEPQRDRRVPQVVGATAEGDLYWAGVRAFCLAWVQTSL